MLGWQCMRPQIRYAAAAEVDTQRGAYFTAVAEVGGEGVTDGLETGSVVLWMGVT